MQVSQAYKNSFTGQAYQNASNALRSEFEYHRKTLEQEIKPLMLGRKYPKERVFQRLALLQEHIKTLQAKAEEFYAVT